MRTTITMCLALAGAAVLASGQPGDVDGDQGSGWVTVQPGAEPAAGAPEDLEPARAPEPPGPSVSVDEVLGWGPGAHWADIATPAERMSGAELARMLNAVPAADRLRAYHELVASEPHDAGTPGDERVVDTVERLMRGFGLEVERQEIQVYLSRPVSGEVRVLAPDIGDPAGLGLATREGPVEGDPYSADERARGGWNAYSGSGDVTGAVVYANYGRLEDFEKLRELGVDLRGKVVLARYGENFRGYKAKYAEQAGAAALVLYTDPADDGWGRGVPYPEGGYANGSSIQRGSIKALDYPGDPLTPFEASVEGARRLNPERVGLPTIPVQPIGWDAASEILSRMAGESVPDGWQGGLPFRYRVTGGDELSVRVAVEQERGLVTTWNVIGRVEGAEFPGQEVILGCHHDAWGFGAGDPASGLICLLETARSFGVLAQNGVRPRRSVVFGAWAAEEHGIVGSVEYVESRSRELGQHAVAYLNLDMAAMGPDFGASASPSLRTVIAEAASAVPQARDASVSVLDAWMAREHDTRFGLLPRFGDLGGGSDHVGFLCQVCVPSAGLRAGGAPGKAYHTVYDDLAWYREVVGDDYEPALMVTRVTNGVAARLAHSRILPLDPAQYGAEVLAELRELVGDHPALARAEEQVSRELAQGQAEMPAKRVGGEAGALGSEAIERINADLIAIERDWCAASFDDGRRWYRNGYAAPDAARGYAAWVLPGVRAAIAAGDASMLERQGDAVAWWVRGQQSRLRSIDGVIRAAMPDEPEAAENDAPKPEFGRFEMEAVEVPSDDGGS